MKRLSLLALALSATLAGCAYQKPAGPTVAVQPQTPTTTLAPASAAAAPIAGLPKLDLAAAKGLLTPDETLQTLDFPETGAKTLSGRIVGYKTAVYALPIRKGQRLDVTMDTKSSSAYFNIQDVKDTSGAALFAGETAATNTAVVRASEDATLLLRPYLNRAVARRGSSADYTFKIERK